MKRMQATYMVIRYLPDVPREEFVNVGVVLICPDAGFQDIRILDHFREGSRAKALGGDGLFVRHALTKLHNIIAQRRVDDLLGKEASPDGQLTREGMALLQEVFCNNIRFSPLRTAVTSDPAATLAQLFRDYVGDQQPRPEPRTVTRTLIRKRVHEVFEQFRLFSLGLKEDWRLPLLTEPTVDLAYKNDAWHFFQAISFAGHERAVKTAVNAYRQTARDAWESDTEVRDAQFVALIYRPSQTTSQIRNLEEALKHDNIQLRDYRDAPEIAKDIKRDLEVHLLIR